MRVRRRSQKCLIYRASDTLNPTGGRNVSLRHGRVSSRPSTSFALETAKDVDARDKPGHDGEDEGVRNHPAASSWMIGPNSCQRSPSNFIICNCLLTR